MTIDANVVAASAVAGAGALCFVSNIMDLSLPVTPESLFLGSLAAAVFFQVWTILRVPASSDSRKFVVAPAPAPTRHRGTFVGAGERRWRVPPAMATTGPAGKARDPIYRSKERIRDPMGAITQVKNKRVVVVTGASSGLGLSCTRSLVERGDHFVIMACRDVEKGLAAAQKLGFPQGTFKVMKLELASLESTRDFVENLRTWLGPVPLHHLVCNAAVYLPTSWTPRFTDDGYEMSMGVNHLGHFLLVNLLLKDLEKSIGKPAGRVTIVGSVTGNTNTVAGRLVYPNASLGDLSGMEPDSKSVMVDGSRTFDGAKAYKDSKLMNMVTVLELHRRFHQKTGIVFNSMYPGCICDTGLFREKRAWFRKAFFPFLMKFITRAYVSEKTAGDRLAQCVWDPQLQKSGVYWGWNGAANLDGTANGMGTGGELGYVGNALGIEGGKDIAFEGAFSAEVTDPRTGARVWDLSCSAAGCGRFRGINEKDREDLIIKDELEKIVVA